MADLNENGKIIQFVNGAIKVPDHPVVPYISGDGCGPEIWLSTRQVVDFAIRSVYGSARSIEWKEVLAGQKSFDLSGSWLPEETLQAFRKYHIGIKGPLNTPIGEGIRSLNVALRKELDLYACLRPIKYYPGAPSPLRHPEDINITLFRENTEDVYSGIEFESGSAESQKLLGFLKTNLPQSYAKIRFPDSSALGIKPISREGSERIIRTAIEWALRNDRKTVTILHKGNIMKFTEGGFLNWGYALADSEFAHRLYTSRQWKRSALRAGEAVANGELENARSAGKLILNDMIVDASFEWAITRPQEMDVLVTTNLNGDYLSDALAALVGGLGIAPGANINFQNGNAIFEAVHGTAPTLAGKDLANPCSLILSSVLLLRYLNWNEAADLIEKSLEETLKSGKVTADFHVQGKGTTSRSTTEFTQDLIQRMEYASH